MTGQNKPVLSREVKKEILKAHMHYVREELETCERAHRNGDKELFCVILKNLYTCNFYLEDLGVFNVEKTFLLNDIIDRIVDGFLYQREAQIA